MCMFFKDEMSLQSQRWQIFRCCKSQEHGNIQAVQLHCLNSVPPPPQFVIILFFLCVYGRKIEVQTAVVCCDKAKVPHNIRSRHNTSGTEQKSVRYMMPSREANSHNVKQECAYRILIITVFKCQLAVFGRFRRTVKSDH